MHCKFASQCLIIMFSTHNAIYRTEEIRRIEAYFLPLASPSLMERAGRAASQSALALLGETDGKRVVVLAGPGNNGGDGFVLARHLLHTGLDVTAVFRAAPDALPEDARAAYGAWRDAGGQILDAPPEKTPDLVVDALFGIGLARPIEGVYSEWIEWCNRQPCPRLAIDCPSGLDVDTGRILGPAVAATHTTTFIAYKPGLLTLDGPDYCGKVTLDELGLDASTVIMPPGHLLTPASFALALTPRRKNSHKGSFGSVAVVGGATSMVGAAILAARAALKLGSGRVYLGIMDPGGPTVDGCQPELMFRSPEAALDAAQVVAIGPGLGQSRPAKDVLPKALDLRVPLVVDADALNLIASTPELATRLAARAAPTLLTPHPTEAARLLACSTDEIQSNRIDAALRLANLFNAHVVLKGCGSVIAHPGGVWLINQTGNEGMASAGMGDVLSGILAALLAQGWAPHHALAGGVWLHGRAADEAVAAGIGPVGLTASDVMDYSRRVLNALLYP